MHPVGRWVQDPCITCSIAPERCSQACQGRRGPERAAETCSEGLSPQPTRGAAGCRGAAKGNLLVGIAASAPSKPTAHPRAPLTTCSWSISPPWLGCMPPAAPSTQHRNHGHSAATYYTSSFPFCLFSFLVCSVNIFLSLAPSLAG